LIEHGWIDRDYVTAHTLGFDESGGHRRAVHRRDGRGDLRVPAADLRRAAEIFGRSRRVLSTVLQGFYQSHQATAAACQVNNLHLLRGLIGRPGCGILQNERPTHRAEHPRVRRQRRSPRLPQLEQPRATFEQLARLWEVDAMTIPALAAAKRSPWQNLRYAEQGSIRLLWISAIPYPAVSLPQLPRIRDILRPRAARTCSSSHRTASPPRPRVADVVLPAPCGGREAGQLHQRQPARVHLSGQGGSSHPCEARSDLDIFLDYARRMDFRDKDGGPLITWSDPGGRVPGLAGVQPRPVVRLHRTVYDRLRGERNPVALQRGASRRLRPLYTDGVFPTDRAFCEDYGHDLLTGGATEPDGYRAANPARAGLSQNRAVRAATGGPERGLSPRGDHRTHGLPLPHPHQDGPRGTVAPDRSRTWYELSTATPPNSVSREGDLVRVQSPGPRWRRPPGFVAAVTAWSSSRSTTATGTPPAASTPERPTKLTATEWDRCPNSPGTSSRPCGSPRFPSRRGKG
jgi:hypothetical protein